MRKAGPREGNPAFFVCVCTNRPRANAGERIFTMVYLNANSGATPLDGRALRHLNARQRACLAANILAEPGPFTPTLLTNILRITPAYIAVARKMSPATRLAILAGTDTRSFGPMLKTKKNGSGIDDSKLLAIVREVGIDRTLAIACVAESGYINGGNGHAAA